MTDPTKQTQSPATLSSRKNSSNLRLRYFAMYVLAMGAVRPLSLLLNWDDLRADTDASGIQMLWALILLVPQIVVLAFLFVRGASMPVFAIAVGGGLIFEIANTYSGYKRDGLDTRFIDLLGLADCLRDAAGLFLIFLISYYVHYYFLRRFASN